ncbi:MAG: phosphatidate cytidylyltransferase [Planctomycetota bacterium]
MLAYRLPLGALMIAGLIGVIALDNRLDQLDLQGTFWQTLFLGRPYLPAGLGVLAMMLVLQALLAREIAGLIRSTQGSADGFLIWLAGFVGCVLMYIVPVGVDGATTVAIHASAMVVLFVLALGRYSWHRWTDGAIVAVAVVMFAFVYAGLLPGFFLAMRRFHSAWMLLAVLMVIKSADIGAYFVGRLIGRHKLIVWLSPGKTWEGLVGGLGFATGVATLLAWMSNEWGWAGSWQGVGEAREYVRMTLPLVFAAGAGLAVAAVGQLGDLAASAFKRDAGTKDSGTGVPGFGGVLDVVDSPILAAPVAFWLLTLAGRFAG